MTNENETVETVIPFDNPGYGSCKRKFLSCLNSMIERPLSIEAIREAYGEIPFCDDPFQFIEKALEKLHIRSITVNSDKSAIPLSGPVIVVSNHPFGGIDGMILAHILSSVRKDIRILANYFLMNIPAMRPLFFAVDPFNKKGSIRKNMLPLVRAVRWLKDGGSLMVFPAGEVSHLSWRKMNIEDPIWSNTVSRLVHMTGSPVLPVYFSGHNSYTFQIAGLINPVLRTALLPSELLKKKGTLIKLRMGSIISYKKLSAIRNPSDLTEYLRFRTYLLGAAINRKRGLIYLPRRAKTSLKRMDKIIRPNSAIYLSEELASLDPQQKLIDSQEFSVYYARAGQVPRILQEIGRLREETFRLAGEGTGKSIDLDRFDNIYIHLFVWNHEKNELVGAYRMGPVDEILERYGKKGLYTHTLFKYRNALLERMGPALELGRTFVRESYQKSFSPLLSLWKGIGQFVVQNPRYKILFGAVSISNEYNSYSRHLMVSFLNMNNYIPELSKMVKPRRRFRKKNIMGLNEANVHLWGDDLEDISSWISSLEEDGKGIPILLKQYIKMGGKILGFNLDRKFCNTLDGLIYVDLRQTDKRLLERYMGKEGLATFNRYHSGAIADHNNTISIKSAANA